MQAWWLGVGLAFSGCAIERTPYDDCAEAGGPGCCSNEDCGANAVCNFDYSCRDRLDGGLSCTEPTGDHECHPMCQDGGRCPTGMECRSFDQTQGAGDPRTLWACF